MTHRRNRQVKVVNKAPNKKGKQEHRSFTSLSDALSWIERNKKRLSK